MNQKIQKPARINIHKDKDQQSQFKVLVVGDASVGKTSILDRYITNQFDDKYNPTIAVDFKIKKEQLTKDTNFTMNFWDFSGHPEFVEVRNEFYREADLIILIFDTTQKRSLDGLDMWLREASDFGAGQVPVVVIGNKVNQKDLAGKRTVTENEGQNWARSRQFIYFECSAKTGQNIQDIFKEVQNKLRNPK